MNEVQHSDSYPEPPAATPRRSVISSVVVGAACGLVLAAAALVLSTAIQRNRLSAFRAVLQDETQDAIARLDHAIRGAEDALSAVVGLYAVNGDVSLAEFQSFCLPIHDHLTGVTSLEWAPVVPAPVWRGFERTVRGWGLRSLEFRERDSSGQLIPIGDREVYYPRTYVVPNTYADPALGFDLGSDPHLARAMHLAVDSGIAVASAPFLPAQHPTGGLAHAVFQPVFYNRRPTDTPEERRAALEGYAVAVVDINAALVGLSNRISIRVEDRTDAPQLLRQAPEQGPATVVHELNLAGRSLVMTTTPGPGRKLPDLGLPWLVLIPGLVIAVLLGSLIVWFGSTRPVRARPAAHEAETTESVPITLGEPGELAAALDADILLELYPEPACILESDGRIRRVNEPWVARLGWAGKTLTGRPWSEFVHSDDREAAGVALAALTHDHSTEPLRIRFQQQYGGYRWLLWRFRLLPAGDGMLAVAHQIEQVPQGGMLEKVVQERDDLQSRLNEAERQHAELAAQRDAAEQRARESQAESLEAKRLRKEAEARVEQASSQRKELEQQLDAARQAREETSGEAETARNQLEKRLADADRKRRELESKLEETDQLRQQLERKAEEARQASETKNGAAEQQVVELKARLEAAEQQAAAADARATESEERRAALEGALADAKRQVEHEHEEAARTCTDLEHRLEEAARRREEVERRLAEVEEARARLERQLAETPPEPEPGPDLVADLCPSPLCVLDADARIIKVNQALTDRLGWSEDQVENRPWLELVHPDDQETAAVAFANLTQGRPVSGLRQRFQLGSGEYRKLSWDFRPHPDRPEYLAAAHAIQNEQGLGAELTEAKRQRQEVFELALLHDFGTKSAVIRGHLDMLATGQLGDLSEEQQQVVQSVRDGFSELNIVRGKLLEESGLDQGAIHLKRQPVAINELIQPSITQANELGKGKDALLAAYVPDFKVDCDPDWMKNAIANLFVFAVTHAAPGARIAVALQQATDQFFLSVVDPAPPTGNQEPPENRLESVELALTRAVVEAHGGRVMLHAGPHGTWLGFSCPMAAPAQTS